MWTVQSNYGSEDFFPTLERELLALIEGEKNLIANLSKISSWLNHSLPNLNWCGFYLWDEVDQELVLGPFQGKPACIRIKAGRGVCGKAYSTNETQRVDDVHQFPGHIACDAASESELVIPLSAKGIVRGVLDLDSPTKSRFSEQDERMLTQIMGRIAEKLW